MGKCNEHLQGHVSLVMGRMLWCGRCDHHYCHGIVTVMDIIVNNYHYTLYYYIINHFDHPSN